MSLSKYILWMCIIPFFFLGCKKKCHDGIGQYSVPLYISVSPVPTVTLGKDTVVVKIWIPYETADIRFPDEKINLKHRKPAKLHAGLMIPPIRISEIQNSTAIYDPFSIGLIKLIPIKGNQLTAGDIAFEFAAGENAWEIEYGFIPQKPYEGIYLFYTSRTQYKDRCVQIDPVTTLVNTPTNHQLIKERFDWAFSPKQNDVLFYVE